ncbi:bifunctional UDP-N-acetylglucosamine diphosphorylase/glucosamine-1-phosphate N-acetyltransferase GlmU [Bacillus sp. TH44]|uniref:bifunctional UDP-N-acetylglucosamine diphosphorylase/glucosamine-1-phosphate N-acetyltransferase GlmU n=1 Tax=unclassified Bacillus (in: firmicutes) TaxID=185979 RepID=UPI00191479D7|nr:MULTISPECIES: bifunctional UDP-N-acetylglucosamine diphosphorylase/glucosamine-1-phosphate N-acetyltransferase GlmU [unclassified Bacillus (in: firmicutes)]MBK5348107.1 bifunctional UDP-N-acetylglucosamine diphosphorylase/glucosamine-1-phosphate N-acetyltransferase GlmU [Bacillus sp. TH45]MBK5360126.1 bifunctional UDP-N-acetylglucosamine diphosphorylase/glucosamine-1-phosphate N-acetyltransferase GlmU [Bacillus sp. TH44]MBK5364994.1 bifunctional UDP-N-acetylglucosamine diphosphorylase/glucosa
MSNRFAVILAAGKGTRMKSKLYKVLHPVCGKPMVQHVVNEVSQLGLQKLVTVVGYGAEKVQEQLGNVSEFALQAEQLGTAHAVDQAASVLANEEGTTLVICGDTPLITAETMEALLQQHEEAGAMATVLTAYIEEPAGYGRIVRNENGHVEKIVEHKDANEKELAIKEINTGTYCFDNKALFASLSKVSNDNVQGEYYLPDVIEILKNEGHIVSAYQTEHFDETLGVNDRVALSQAEIIMKNRINRKNMVNGVTIIDPSNTYISADAIIGSDTVLHPGTVIEGNTVIGSDCEIGPHTVIRDSEIGDRTVIRQSTVHDSKLGTEVSVGPFAHIRPDSVIGDEVRVGNFVEIKKTVFGNRSKASHLSYIGDAQVGEDVNLGCGSITVNYDGKNKFKTVIGNGVFIGCNSNLVAPVTVEDGAYVAAGSTITENVPSKALSVARARQVNKEDYVDQLLNKKKS